MTTTFTHRSHVSRVATLTFALLFCASFIVQRAMSAEPPPPNTLPKKITSDGGSFEVKLTPRPQTVPLNEMFEINLEVRTIKKLDDPNPIWVGVNATMPAHKHGMNTVPRVEDQGGGKFVIRGMLFHMVGDWEIELDVVKGRIHEHAKIPVGME